MKDYYQILEIPANATQAEIKQQYRLLVLAWHPDRFATPAQKAKAEEKIKEINEAHEILSDQKKRADYDIRRSAQSSWFGEEEQRRREQAEEERRRAEYEKQQREQAEAERRRAEYERQQREQAETEKRRSEYERSQSEQVEADRYNFEVKTIVASKKSPVLAASFSLFMMGGAGQIYLGQTKKGAVLILATLLTNFFCVLGSSNALRLDYSISSLVSLVFLVLNSLFGLSLFIVFAGTIDAYCIAKKKNQGVSVGDWEFSLNWITVLVIVVIILVILFLAPVTQY